MDNLGFLIRLNKCPLRASRIQTLPSIEQEQSNLLSLEMDTNNQSKTIKNCHIKNISFNYFVCTCEELQNSYLIDMLVYDELIAIQISEISYCNK